MKKLKNRLLAIVIVVVLLYNPLSARLFTVITAKSFDLDKERFYRLIKSESSFIPWAKSHQGAIGLGQLKPSTARYMSDYAHEFTLWFPPTNLVISAMYMRYLLDKYNDNWSLALAAYNWGETNVSRLVKKKIGRIDSCRNYAAMFRDNRETYNYIRKII